MGFRVFEEVLSLISSTDFLFSFFLKEETITQILLWISARMSSVCFCCDCAVSRAESVLKIFPKLFFGRIRFKAFCGAKDLLCVATLYGWADFLNKLVAFDFAFVSTSFFVCL